MKSSPYIVGGVLMLVGYLWAMLRGLDEQQGFVQAERRLHLGSE